MKAYAFFVSMGIFSFQSNAQAEDVWIHDTKGNCEFLNYNAHPNETASWDGACVKGRASGIGTVAWYLDGKLSHSTRGEMHAGLMEGPVTVTYVNGSVITSVMRAGHLDGPGTLRGKGIVITGTYRAGNLEGPAKLTSPDGSVLTGTMEAGKWEGHAYNVYADGRVLTGTMHLGKLEGPGTETYPNGKVFSGLLHAGNFEGPATLEDKNGEVLSGNIKNGDWDGITQLKFPNGAILSGTLQAGKFEGPATLKDKNGKVVSGNIKNGDWDGITQLKYPNGAILSGTLQAGKFEGPGSMAFANGLVFYGEYRGGSPISGVLKLADGSSCTALLTQENDITHYDCAPGSENTAIYSIEAPLPDAAPSGRDMISAILTGVTQGMNQVTAARNQNRVNASPSPTYTPPPPPPPTYNTQTYATNTPVYDNSLDQCVTLGGDSQSVYFSNRCNASVTIMEFQRGQGVPETVDCGPGGRCTFGVFGVGYTSRENYIIAVCPQGDYIESSPGVQWSGSGPFRCRRP